MYELPSVVVDRIVAIALEEDLSSGDLTTEARRGIAAAVATASAPMPSAAGRTTWQMRAIRYLLDLEEMSCSIAEIEGDGKGVPVLLRQYMNLGGNILEFNVDPQFSNAVDGLILVDLLKADRRLLARYMGREGLASFCAFHNV